ncbi:MAG: ThuA domain-containing protein [Cyclobacteriaceae bacterium]|nr:ThuA domain-containing protein [Cyclobacteriaceae bacterium]MDH4297535.1 ThuA domain-containing protein [Cyclobacteriaceae bacterium]MDH5250878.1 ThuA domain-containing protein [Cyclobacteriaceae bacterium]
MKRKSRLHFLLLTGFLLVMLSCQKQTSNDQPNEHTETPKMRALIIDGQNNHGIWPKTTMMMKDYLEETGLFTVDVARMAFTYQGPHNDNDEGFDEIQRKALLELFPVQGSGEIIKVPEPKADPNYKPDFSQYNVVISNFGWKAAAWPKETQEAFELYMKNGGGLVIVHAANNSFGDWDAFNEMIGLGGWGDRDEKNGPYVYYNDANELVRDTTAGEGGSHGKQYSFMITMRDTSHPITKGMPQQWLHARDELYDRLRGPAENMNILATAYSDEEKNDSPFSDLRGTNRHEPMMLTVNYGKGRIFHTPLGHTYYSMECVGFIVSLQRGAEWAATGKVSQGEIPADFPTAQNVSQRKWSYK